MKKKILLICLACYCTSFALIGQDFEIASYEFSTKEILKLLKENNKLTTFGVGIVDRGNKKIIYEYSVNAGAVEILKVNDSTFFLIGNFTFPYADIYASFEIGKHILKIKRSGLVVEIDKTFSNCPRLHPETLKDIPIKYNRMKQDSSFTSKDWEKITRQNVDSVQNLSYELMLGILNGSKECVPLFQNIRKDFDIINAGAGSEQLMGCEFVLQLYGYIKKDN